MKTSDKGLALIREFEGLRLNAYRCPAGVWTIGYGHTSAAGAPVVRAGMKISKQRAEEILRADLAKYEQGVLDAVSVPLRQEQFDALVSFAYNCGVGALRKSTLLKRVNAKRFSDVPAELMKWTRAGGRELPGLVRRRRAEAALWRGIAETPPNPTETRVSPDAPQPPKTIAQSREANAAVIAGGASAVAAATEILPHAATVSDALGRPAFVALVIVILACAAIWWWRRERLLEEGA